MLVLSLRKDGQGRVPHVLAQCENRIGLSPKSLLQTVTEINLYLPDDWRLTRSQNDFRILVVSGDACYSLVGKSFRCEGDNVLHVVDTVLTPSQSDQPGANRSALSEQPELLTPNLYFFQPCPDNSSSPLFARQYEKTRRDAKGKQTGTQYHRVHPLTKGGLDADHFRWLKWDITGHVEFVDYPDPSYHGKDYWMVPELNARQMRGETQDYIRALETLLADHGIRPPQAPERPPTPYEEEYKLRGDGEATSRKDMLAQVRNAVVQLGIVIEHESKPQEQVDIYLDDDQLTLYRRGVSLRLRKTKGAAHLTLKARPSDGPNASEGCHYRRIEEEVAISNAQENALLKGHWISALPYRLVFYMAPECGSVTPVARVRTNRVRLTHANEFLQKAELCYDSVHYEVGSRTYGPDIEVEIESRGLPRGDVAALASLLMEALQLTPSAESKYERALRLSGVAPSLPT